MLILGKLYHFRCDEDKRRMLRRISWMGKEMLGRIARLYAQLETDDRTTINI